MSNSIDVVIEKVQWNDVQMLRTHFNKKKRNFDIFTIPDALFIRWNESIDEFWEVQHEIMQYQSGEKCLLHSSKGYFKLVNGEFLEQQVLQER